MFVILKTMLYCSCNNLPHPHRNCPILSNIEDANILADLPPPIGYILTQEQRDTRFENGWRRRIDNGTIVFYQIEVSDEPVVVSSSESEAESEEESDVDSDVESDNSDDVVIVSRQNNKIEAVRELADLVDTLSDKMDSDAYKQLMDLCGKLYNT